MKLVKYKPDINKIIDAIEIFSCDGNSLLLCPPLDETECYCFVIADISENNIYITSSYGYVNYAHVDEPSIKSLINKAMKIYPKKNKEIDDIKKQIAELQQQLEELEST